MLHEGGGGTKPDNEIIDFHSHQLRQMLLHPTYLAVHVTLLVSVGQYERVAGHGTPVGELQGNNESAECLHVTSRLIVLIRTTRS